MTRPSPPGSGLRLAELLEWKDHPASVRREPADVALRLSLLGVAAIEAGWFAALGLLIYRLAGRL
jgi:hypothetical protein